MYTESGRPITWDMENYYNVLELDEMDRENLDPFIVRKQYLKMAKRYHPDSGGTSESFQKIHKAYEVLVDPVKKRKYDVELFGPTCGGWWASFRKQWLETGVDVNHLLAEAARKISLDVSWSADVIVTLPCHAGCIGKSFTIEYTAVRHKLNGIVLDFIPTDLSVCVVLDDWDEENYFIIENQGNDVIDCHGQIVRGDLLLSF